MIQKRVKSTGISEKVVRLLEIYSIIAQKKFPSVGYLAERYRVSERTIYRYLSMIGSIDLIGYDRDREGYTFINGDRLKKLILSDEELITLLTAGEAVSHLGTTFQESFKRLIERMFLVTEKTARKGKLPIIVKVPDMVQGDKIGDSLKIISSCISERHPVQITYRAHRSKDITDRRVDPYGMVFYEGVWLLIGYCHLRKEIRSFALDRILKCSEQDYCFIPRVDFDLEEYLSHSWGVIDGEEVTVVVRFKPDVTDYIVRKEKWHPSEKRKILPDGGVELTFTVAGIYEIKKWIYSWLPNIEVIKPKWFRKEIHKELTQATKDHNQNP